MAGQVVRRLRRRPPGEIVGGAHHRHSQVRPDPHGDHVFRDLLPEPDPGVEAIGDDVGEPLVEAQLDVDVRIVRQQALQRGPQDGFGRLSAGGDADRPRGLVPKLADRHQLRLDLVQAWADRRQKPLSGVGGRNAARGPRQQPHPEPLLEPAQGVAEGRGGDAELGRRAGEAPLPGHADEGDEVADVRASHS